MGGAGNTINVSALPPIPSYPVTVTLIQSASPIIGFNATLGTLPAGSPPFSGSIALSGDQLAVRLTLTAGPVGVRPNMFWTGADLPNLNTNWSDGQNWFLPGAPTSVDNAIFNNTATVAASALTTPGGGSAALRPGEHQQHRGREFHDFFSRLHRTSATLTTIPSSTSGRTLEYDQHLDRRRHQRRRQRGATRIRHHFRRECELERQ